MSIYSLFILAYYLTSYDTSSTDWCIRDGGITAVKNPELIGQDVHQVGAPWSTANQDVNQTNSAPIYNSTPWEEATRTPGAEYEDRAECNNDRPLFGNRPFWRFSRISMVMSRARMDRTPRLPIFLVFVNDIIMQHLGNMRLARK